MLTQCTVPCAAAVVRRTPPVRRPTQASLFADVHGAYFERDTGVLQGLGASTLLLEPRDVGRPARHLQGLFNATNFIFAEGISEIVPRRVRTAAPLRVVPGLDFSALTTTSQQDICRKLREHARLLKMPEPSPSATTSGVGYGGGVSTSKDNLAAFQLVPACAAYHLDMLDDLAKCVRDEVPTVPVYVGLAQADGCDVAAVLSEKLTPLNNGSAAAWSHVDGAVVDLSRAHGCDASSTARALVDAANGNGTAAAARDKPFTLWLGVGVDAFDTSAGGEYATVRSSTTQLDSYLTVTDARTHCLLSLLDSVDAGGAGCAEDQCAVVVHEYADSFFRAAHGYTPTGSWQAAAQCAVARDGAPSSSDRLQVVRTEQLSCGSCARHTRPNRCPHHHPNRHPNGATGSHVRDALRIPNMAGTCRACLPTRAARAGCPRRALRTARCPRLCSPPTCPSPSLAIRTLSRSPPPPPRSLLVCRRARRPRRCAWTLGSTRRTTG
jgi:hypothetical protein